mmetsp:Transcript_18779/g.31451  ORF Transcript_18779/g.31451 Transcript_18779/m.31451 type:complete len:366 (+) Transcript_18779:2-1099(+)
MSVILCAAQEQKMSIKLLDRPLTDFIQELSGNDIALIAQYMHISPPEVRLLIRNALVTRTYLGCRGCRVATLHSEIMSMQAAAILFATLDNIEKGMDLRPTLLVPNVTCSKELETAINVIQRAALQVVSDYKQHSSVLQYISQFYSIGVLIGAPRACLRADTIAALPAVSTIAFNVEELTAQVFACSREEARTCFPHYISSKVYAADPFRSLDDRAVGKLMKTAIVRANAVRAGTSVDGRNISSNNISNDEGDARNARSRSRSNSGSLASKVGDYDIEVPIDMVEPIHWAVVQGEHTADYRSINLFLEMGIDSVSCLPHQVPLVKLGAAQATMHTYIKAKRQNKKGQKSPQRSRSNSGGGISNYA